MAVTKNILRVHLVNGDVRAVKYGDGDDCTAIIRWLLTRLKANVDAAVKYFGLNMVNKTTNESYWLIPGVPASEFIRKYLRLPLDDWKFILKLWILPKTPQHLLSQDMFSYLYLYEQALHRYLEDHDIRVDNATALKLGCLELRRFYRDLPQIALSRPENFKILEKDIGLEKFFRKSLLHAVKPKNLRKQVIQYFREIEGLSDEACINQFFHLLSKLMAFDIEVFPKCAVDEHGPLTNEIHIGPNCDIELHTEIGESKLIALFQDICDVQYHADIGTRGKLSITISMIDQPLQIRTGHLTTAMNMATLLNGYCQVLSPAKHSRMKQHNNKKFSPPPALVSPNGSRPPMPLPHETASMPPTSHGDNAILSSYGILASTYGTVGSDFDDYAEISEKEFSSTESKWHVCFDQLVIGERIGEGQFGDVHTGIMDSNVKVAIKSCKAASTIEEKHKFMREAAVMKEFSHPHIITLHGWTFNSNDYYILMELAPYGELRNYLIANSGQVTGYILLNFVSQLASALSYLESKNYVHRDIAARNLLVVTPYCVKLGDFGLSRWLDEGTYYVSSQGKLPIKWMAPESIYYRRFTTASDVWMFGVCTWEILMRGVKPFMGIKNQDVIGRIENGDRLQLPKGCPPRLYHLMMRCWAYTPEERPSFTAIEEKIKEILHQETKEANPDEISRIETGCDYDTFRSVLSKSINGVSTESEDELFVETDKIQRSKSPMEFHPLSSSSSMSPTHHPSQSPKYRGSSESGCETDFSNRPLPPPPPEFRTRTSSEPVYSPVQKSPSKTNASPVRHSGNFVDDSPLSTPNESEEVGYSYVTVGEGGGMDQRIHSRPLPSPPPDDQFRPRPLPTPPPEEVEDSEDQEMIDLTTKVVQCVVELNGGVSSKDTPIENYVPMVMSVGVALKALMANVDGIKSKINDDYLPEVEMAEKVLQTNLKRLIDCCKECQNNQERLFFEDCKKSLLLEGHNLARNAKSLYEVVHSRPVK